MKRFIKRLISNISEKHRRIRLVTHNTFREKRFKKKLKNDQWADR
jgi:hypothetical protein